MNTALLHPLTFHQELKRELESFLTYQKLRFPEDEVLVMDMHCHDYNSDVPDELLGRILNVPETWLPTKDLLETLTHHGCNTYTITNHNNARSCFEQKALGEDVLAAAEFSCMVPDFQIGIHVLTYGFTQEQEKDLNKLRSNLYSFLDYTHRHNIPTVWAHPLYHYTVKVMPSMDFFNKMALIFERFEVINGQRDTWQNMLVKVWIESLTPERIDELAKQTGIDPARYCHNPYRKTMTGGSDSHMGIFAGLAGTYLHVPNLKERRKTESTSELALEAIREGRMAPFGSHNNSEKLTVAFLEYFFQIALNSKDPGLLRILLHKGTSRDKLIALGVSNAFAELKRHKVTMNFIEMFHKCFCGVSPHFTKRWFVPKVYKPIFDEATKIADTRKQNPEMMVETFRNSISSIFEQLNIILADRLTTKLEALQSSGGGEKFNLNHLIESFEVPSQFRTILDSAKNGNGTAQINGMTTMNVSAFLDGLSFPFLTAALVLGATFTSAHVIYNTRPLLNSFASQMGRFRHPKRMLWLTDTFEDKNGVAIVLKSIHEEIKRRNLPIDLLVCSSTLEPDDHLIVVKPQAEFSIPFYEQQPVRIPNVLEIHELFLEGEYDRIMCSTEGAMGLISLYLKNAYSVPTHFYIHTDWIMFARKVLNFDIHNLNRFRRLLRAFYGSFDSLFVLNTDQQKWLTGKSMAFEPEKVFLTAHWADDGFEPKQKSKAEIFGVEEHETVVLFAGRISNEKGVMELPAIYAEVKESYPTVRFAVVGTGPAEAELKAALPEAIYLGWVEHTELAEVYSAADLLILPSKFDTFGCVVLEALSCRLPVIAYKTKGPKDIILDGENGYLSPSRADMVKKIGQYIQNPDLQKAFKVAALERAKFFSTDRIVNQLLQDVNLV